MAITEKTLNQFTEQQMIEKALEVERLEAAIKLMKADLKEWVEANGPLTAGDKVWDFNISVSWEFSPEKLKELSQLIVIDAKNPWDYLTLPAASLKKLNWDENVLSQYGVKKETKKFSSRKSN